jgi:hypothetical protein
MVRDSTVVIGPLAFKDRSSGNTGRGITSMTKPPTPRPIYTEYCFHKLLTERSFVNADYKHIACTARGETALNLSCAGKLKMLKVVSCLSVLFATFKFTDTVSP